MYDVLQRRIQYLDRCVAESASEVVEAPGASVPFYLEPILVEMVGERYLGLIILVPLSYLLAGRHGRQAADVAVAAGAEGLAAASAAKIPSPRWEPLGGPRG